MTCDIFSAAGGGEGEELPVFHGLLKWTYFFFAHIDISQLREGLLSFVART